jgi:hypothetical protein
MSTRSRIAIKLDDNNIKSVYCRNGGYPSWNGKMLLEHHNSREAAEKIIALGDLSSLHESLEKPEGHSFDTRIEGYTVAYMRDRGETGCKAIRDENTNELVRTADQSDGEYVYLFDCKKNKWYYLVTRVAMNNLRKGINAKPLRWYALNQKNTAEK